MNCHKDRSNHERHNHKTHKGHLLLMVICCGAPFLLVLLVPLLGRLNLGTWTALPFLSSLICPITMVVMMGMMMLGQKKNSRRNAQPSDFESEGKA